jgi:MFS family permease
VDHPCEKCGAAVEDGRPFCPQCRAPQIHVQFEVPAVDTAAAVNDTADQPSVGIPQLASFDRSTAMPPGLLDRGNAVRAALKAGLLGVFIGMIPVLGIVLTGSLGVFFYRRARGTAPALRIGARVGAAAGVVSFAINSLLIVIRIFSMHGQQEYIDAITKIAQAVGYNTADPVIQASIRNLVSPAGLALTFFFGMIFTVTLAAVGGVVAAALFRSSSRP